MHAVTIGFYLFGYDGIRPHVFQPGYGCA